MNKQTGFTMIELMIAIGLGLLIVAAAFLMLFTGQKNVALQKSSASLQDDQNFGLAYMAKNIRQANLFSPSATLNASSSYAGIIFSVSNLDSKVTVPTDFASKYSTSLQPSSTGITASNMRIKSGSTFSDATNDQLTIQYRPPENGYDCEGNNVTSSQYVVERYFVRTDTNGAGSVAERSALACAASRYNVGLATATNLDTTSGGIYSNGQIIMKRVDLFNVRFLTQSSAGQRYMTVQQYNALTGTKPRILAVQLAIIARAEDPTTEQSVSTSQEFSIFGQTFTQKTSISNRYIRTPIVQTVALRNALGVR